jgi:hypothetical protein
MNIFMTSECPIESANNLDSKRVNKMLLESCQMLSTAVNECGGKAPYKSTHKNHPSNVWVRQSKKNYSWLWIHAEQLAHIYKKETGKTHKCEAILLELTEPNHYSFIPDGEITELPNCAANTTKGVSFKHLPDVTEAYRQYLCVRWDNDIIKPVWKNRPIPSFYKGIYA